MFPASHYVASQSRDPFVREHFVRKVRRWRLRKRLSDGRVYLGEVSEGHYCVLAVKSFTPEGLYWLVITR